MLTFEHIAQALQRSLIRTCYQLATTPVVKQRIDSFLKHPLFVADDDFRRIEFLKTLQTVVTIDYTTVQIVKIGGREAAAVKRNKRTKIWGNHRDYLKQHPLRLIG